MEEILTGTEAVDTTPAGENEQERAEPAPDTAGQGENGQGTEEIPNAEPCLLYTSIKAICKESGKDLFHTI